MAAPMIQHPDEMDVVLLAVDRPDLRYDSCCSRTLTRYGPAGRCQLWAGHDGAHAVLFVRDGERTVRTWRAGHADDHGTEDDGADFRGMPWARGFPQPAWRIAPSQARPA